MVTMTKRQVARETPNLWSTVEAGETVYILDHGKPAYRVEAVDGLRDPLEDLALRGQLMSAQPQHGPLAPAMMPRGSAAAVIDLFEQDRHDDEG